MTDNGLYQYREYKEMGMRAREANVLKTEVKSADMTRTQRSFWVLGWEEKDRELGGDS